MLIRRCFNPRFKSTIFEHFGNHGNASSLLVLFPVNSIGSNVVRIEAEALRELAERIAGPMAGDFTGAVECLHACGGRVVVTGMGKSGIIARKIAATLSSTGTPALYLHPAEAIHGDLGMVVKGDVVLALSYSGETEEILQLLATIRRTGVKLVTITGDRLYPSSDYSGKGGSTQTSLPQQSSLRQASTQHSSPQQSSTGANPATQGAGGKRSTLAQAADIALDCSVDKEACSMGLAPTASTTAMLALGDALALSLADKRGFKEEDFANLHPGGKLGKKLARVSQLMHSGDAIPRVERTTKMSDVIYEMSRKGLGITTVVDRRKAGGRDQRRRSATVAAISQRHSQPHCRRLHDDHSQDDYAGRIRNDCPAHDGREKDHLIGRDAVRWPGGRNYSSA